MQEIGSVQSSEDNLGPGSSIQEVDRSINSDLLSEVKYSFVTERPYLWGFQKNRAQKGKNFRLLFVMAYAWRDKTIFENAQQALHLSAEFDAPF